MSITTKNISSYNFAQKVLPYSVDTSTDSTKTLTLIPGEILELDFSNVDENSDITISSITVTGADESNFAISELIMTPGDRAIVWPNDIIWIENGAEGASPDLLDGLKYHFTVMENNNNTIFINLSYNYSV